MKRGIPAYIANHRSVAAALSGELRAQRNRAVVQTNDAVVSTCHQPSVVISPVVGAE